jgi:hypothetical protein
LRSPKTTCGTCGKQPKVDWECSHVNCMFRTHLTAAPTGFYENPEIPDLPEIQITPIEYVPRKKVVA